MRNGACPGWSSRSPVCRYVVKRRLHVVSNLDVLPAQVLPIPPARVRRRHLVSPSAARDDEPTRRLARRCTARLVGTLPGIQVRAQSNDGHQPTSRATSTSRKDPGACFLSESAAPRALRGARLRKASCRSTLTQPGVPRFSGDEGIRDLRERARV